MFRDRWGCVYIFENVDAKLVKVGLTVNAPHRRLDDLNKLWEGNTVTCQICRARLQPNNGVLPKHPKETPRPCIGSHHLPFEKDVTFAETYLEKIIDKKGHEVDGRKITLTVINTLKKHIEKFRHFKSPLGDWRFVMSFFSEDADLVEKTAHQALDYCLNDAFQHGEIFDCSAEEAIAVVEKVLLEMQLLDSVIRESNSHRYHSNPNPRPRKTYSEL